MDNLILSSIPLAELQESISKIVEEKLKSYWQETAKQSKVKKYATRDEVAKLLHISLPTLNQLTKSGSLLAYRIGSRVLYDLDEVNASLNQIITTKYKRQRN